MAPFQYIDKDFWYENFTEEEQNKILKAQRSNNTLVMRLPSASPPALPFADDDVQLSLS